ncbi:MAG: hypothetical protein IJI14_14385 [Anaerolineaceae bacterium]|nr:hypothetical protein [Anaerolineaceae bacterium]
MCVQISVNGKWLTDLIRIRFWDEDESFEKCMDLISACFPEADKSQLQSITTALLEGRKTLSEDGVLIEDKNAIVRPMSEKAEYYRRKLLKQLLIENMENNFIPYVDQWSTVKSVHSEALYHAGSPKSYSECVDYFGSVTSSTGEKIILAEKLESPTAAGLWLHENTDLVFHIVHDLGCAAGTDEFWHEVYLSVKDDPQFSERTNKYEAYIARRNETDRVKYDMKYGAKNPIFRYLSPEWFVLKKEETRNDDYNVIPDRINTWTGLISPTGDFFSCSYGGHEIKAFYLIAAHPEYAGLSLQCETDIDEELLRRNGVTKDNALDILINKRGWCATRYMPYIGHYVTEPELPVHMTAAQQTVIEAAAAKFGVETRKDVPTTFRYAV